MLHILQATFEWLKRVVLDNVREVVQIVREVVHIVLYVLRQLIFRWAFVMLKRVVAKLAVWIRTRRWLAARQSSQVNKELATPEQSAVVSDQRPVAADANAKLVGGAV